MGGGSKKFEDKGGEKILGLGGGYRFGGGGGGTFAEGVSTPLNAMITNPTLITAFDTYLTPRSPGAW